MQGAGAIDGHVQSLEEGKGGAEMARSSPMLPASMRECSTVKIGPAQFEV